MQQLVFDALKKRLDIYCRLAKALAHEMGFCFALFLLHVLYSERRRNGMCAAQARFAFAFVRSLAVGEFLFFFLDPPPGSGEKREET